MDQFGDVLPTGNLTFPIRHAGQYYDAEVNIFYNYFRYYDPITGRYVESDPIGLDGGLNTYGYVNSSPLRFVDPYGLEKEKYKKPENPNKRKGADDRKPTGDRERNVGHPEGEEHSKRPKGGFRLRSPIFILPLNPCLIMPEICTNQNEASCPSLDSDQSSRST